MSPAEAATWLAAGYAPNEAKRLAGSPDGPSPQELQVMGALRN